MDVYLAVLKAAGYFPVEQFGLLIKYSDGYHLQHCAAHESIFKIPATVK